MSVVLHTSVHLLIVLLLLMCWPCSCWLVIILRLTWCYSRLCSSYIVLLKLYLFTVLISIIIGIIRCMVWCNALMQYRRLLIKIVQAIVGGLALFLLLLLLLSDYSLIIWFRITISKIHLIFIIVIWDILNIIKRIKDAHLISPTWFSIQSNLRIFQESHKS